MKRLLALTVLLVVGLLGWLRFRTEIHTPPPAAPTAPNPQQPAAHATLPPPTVHPLTADLGPAPDRDPNGEPQQVLAMLDAWRRATGRFPVAEDNAGLMRQLTSRTGNRPPLIQPDHPRLNTRGELLDPWDTPYFFHHIAAQHLEVRSAGPDRTFYTDDDIVAAPPRPQSASGPPTP
jgi:hypothetical protein